MTPDVLRSAIDVAAASPDRVREIRRLILKAAVGGHLAERRAADGDGPANAARMRAERSALVEQGVGKKEKVGEVPTPPLADTPDHWTWAKLVEVTSYIQRGKGPKYVDQSTVPIVSQKCVQWSGFDLARARFLDAAALEKYGPERFLQPGDLLWNSTGTGTIGRVNVFPEGVPHEVVVADSHVTVLRPLSGLSPRFLWVWLASPAVQDTIEDLATGTTKQQELGTGTVKSHPVPIPPLAEQGRIVAKVDQLMALCDELEEKQTLQRKLRVSLNDACLDRLLGAENADEFAEHWERIVENFDVLYDDPANVERLKDTVTDLAIRGRLSRLPSQKNALNIILGHHKSHIAEAGDAKARSRRALTLPSLQERAFEAPAGWVWSRIGISAVVSGGVTKGRKLADRKTEALPYLRVANVQAGSLDLSVIKEIDVNVEEVPRFALMHGDVLLTEGGDWDKLGRSALWRSEIDRCVHQNHVFKARVRQGLNPEWLSMFTNSCVGREYFQSKAKRTTNLASINMTELRGCPLPIPPPDEQERLLSLVRVLHATCSVLLDALACRADVARQLAEAARVRDLPKF